MPKLQNIANAVAGAAAHHLVVEPGRCMEVRHRAARCHACVEACPQGALEVGGNRIAVSPELCDGCGACANACPTQALRTASPSWAELAALVDALAADAPPEGPGTLEFACAHAAESSIRNRIVVPALPYVDEALVAHAAAQGFSGVVLTSCGKCPCLEAALAAMPAVVASARNLLQAAGSPCTVTLRRQKPGSGKTAPARAQAAPGGAGVSRRDALSGMAAQMRSIVAETAAAEMHDALGTQPEEPSLRQVLLEADGSFAKFPMPRRQELLDSLYRMNPQPTGTVEARGFGRVVVNAAACSRCALCARFCPTGALQGEGAPIGAGPVGAWPSQDAKGAPGSLAHLPGDCVACRLCETACPLNCLTVQEGLDAPLLFRLTPINLLP